MSSTRTRRPGAAATFGPPAPGTPVVAHLRDPREKMWGFLLSLDGAGAWLRGIELASFEAWAHQEAGGEETGLALSTVFVPFLRVEKFVVDEATGAIGSLSDRFEAIAGVAPHTRAGLGGGVP